MMSNSDIYKIKNIYIEGSLDLGKNVSIECFASIICYKRIVIGENTMVGPGAVIVDIDHYTGPDFTRTTELAIAEPISIGRDCWIGANAVVLKGVTLGDGCIVGAGAVVTKSFIAGSIIVGNPAYLLRMR